MKAYYLTSVFDEVMRADRPWLKSVRGTIFCTRCCAVLSGHQGPVDLVLDTYEQPPPRGPVTMVGVPCCALVLTKEFMRRLQPALLPELRRVIGSVSSQQIGPLDDFVSIYGLPRLRVAKVGGEGSEYKLCPICNSITDQKLTEPECFPVADLTSDVFFNAAGGSLYVREPAIEACDLRSVPGLQIIEVAACGEEPPPWGADWWRSIPD